MKIAAITLLLALMSMAAITPGSAQTGQEAVDAFPNRPVRIIVPFPAGGPTDIMARILGQKLSDAWKQRRIDVRAATLRSLPKLWRWRARTATRCLPPWTRPW